MRLFRGTGHADRDLRVGRGEISKIPVSVVLNLPTRDLFATVLPDPREKYSKVRLRR